MTKLKSFINILLLICAIQITDPVRNEACKVACRLDHYKNYSTGYYVKDECWCIRKKSYRDAVHAYKDKEDTRKWSSEIPRGLGAEVIDLPAPPSDSPAPIFRFNFED